MIILGVVLIIIGLLVHLGILTTIGIVVAVVGLILLCAGAVTGAAIAGRKHWY